MDLCSLTEALTFDDVLLEPAYSSIIPSDCQTSCRVTRRISLNMPLISAAMDTLTESTMAIAMARNGGLGIIHKNMTIENQAKEVIYVKRHEAGMVVDPVSIAQYETLQVALEMMEKHGVKTLVVVEDMQSQKLVGLLTNRDTRFVSDRQQQIRDLMTRDLITVSADIDMSSAASLLHFNRIEKILVVEDNRCVGLITAKDIEKIEDSPLSVRDSTGRLLVGAAVGVSDREFERAQELIRQGCDVIAVDTAHGHSQLVLDQVKRLKAYSDAVDIIGGNVATAAAALALVDVGADAIKVGIGPGSICTTRIVAGVGVPQLTAIQNAVRACRDTDVTVIADGGIRYSGDLAKAIAVGADCAMIGSLLAGTDEAPGETFIYQGRSYKSYRGMGSEGAMSQGSADRYFQEQCSDGRKFVPEGVEARVAYKGSVTQVLEQMVGGLRSAMGYTGNRTIPEMQRNCVFNRITGSGWRESHVHDVTVTRESPNYKTQ